MAPLPSLQRLAVRSAPVVALAATSLALTVSKHHKHHDDWSQADSDAQKIKDQWSSVFGWVSIMFWVFVYSPSILPSFSQLKENYDRKSGEGLSILFVLIWLAGDLLNLVGAWRQELLWTMIVLAGYYSLCDVALIFQYYYYRKHHDFYHKTAIAAEPTEATPLVPGNKTAEEEQSNSTRTEVIKYTVAALLVIAVGIAAWWLDGSRTNDGPVQKPSGPGWRWDAQIYGWLSAVLYLASRIPQIFKNRETKCEGLSLALFLFAVAGNTTYVASILLKSTDPEYVMESLSWLVGSVGTVFLDFIVLGQFISYREERKALALAAAGPSSNGNAERS